MIFHKFLNLFNIIKEILNNKYFISFKKRNILSDNINAQSDINNYGSDISIVMQGPIIFKNNFTYETLKLYRKRYPRILIIFSTWDDYTEKIYNKFENLNIILLKNTKPKYFGISNINLQIKTTKCGILKANELNAIYCLKTRSDQRLYRHDFLTFFISLLSIFPLKSETSKLHNRLISTSINTYKYRLYGITDMLMFGKIDDMILYWTPAYDQRLYNEINQGYLLEDWAKAKLCEVYLSTEFAKKIDFNLTWTIENSWKFFASYFCVIDKDAIDLFWYKYDWHNENRSYTNYIRNVKEEFMFSDWLNCYNNLAIYSKEQELYLKFIQK